MREFKFRAVIDNNEIHKVFILNCDGSLEVSFGLIPKHRIKAILQYTGLKDINGKEIYEGDIVKAHSFVFDGNFDGDLYRQGEIGFSHDCCFVIKVDDSQFGFFETSHFEDPCIEVIGNRYENPELLEASQ